MTLADPEKLLLERIDHALERVPDGKLDEEVARDLLAQSADKLESQAAEIAELRLALQIAEEFSSNSVDNMHLLHTKLAAAEAERDAAIRAAVQWVRDQASDDEAGELGEAINAALRTISDPEPIVCPGCYSVGEEPCAPDCIDAEIARKREESDAYDDEEDPTP